MSDGYRVLLGGSARGPLLVLDAPLSLWGGLDPLTGRIIDRNHPDLGRSVTGTILFMPHGRGSSSSSSVLAESLRLGTGPTALVLGVPDGILVVGAAVAGRLYDSVCPVLAGPRPDPVSGDWVVSGTVVAPARQV